MKKLNITKYERYLNCLVPIYFAASYMYEKHAKTIIEDNVYEKICKILHTHFSEINHIHKYLLIESSLECGTGFNLEFEKFPIMLLSFIIKFKENEYKTVLHVDKVLNRFYNMELKYGEQPI